MDGDAASDPTTHSHERARLLAVCRRSRQESKHTYGLRVELYSTWIARVETSFIHFAYSNGNGITRVLLLAWEWMDGRHLPGRHRQHTDRIPSIGDATCQCANGKRDSKQVGAGEEHAFGISHDACTLRPGRKELGAGWPPARVEVREELRTPARCRLPASRNVSHRKREIERLSLLVDVCAARSGAVPRMMIVAHARVLEGPLRNGRHVASVL